MKQPVLGFVALLAVIAVSLGIISLFEEKTFSTWVSFLVMCMVPMQLVMGMVWKSSYPPFLNSLTQPIKGLVMTLITMVVGLVVAVFIYFVIGKGHGITPILMMYTILSVVVTFWIVGLWHCWPITLFTKNPLVIGVSVLILTYLIDYLIFSTFFNFAFLKGAPVYFEDIDPGGMFMAWSVIVPAVTSVAAIMLFPLFEGWPVRAIKNPLLGLIVSTLVVVTIAACVYTLGTSVLGMDPIRYMALVPVSFVFGTFLPLTIFQGGLFANMAQPLKGITLFVTCAIAGFILQRIYLFMGPIVSGPLVAGQAGHHQEELWLANALLGLTFPVLVIMLDYFQFWPISRNSKSPGNKPTEQ